MLKTDADKYEEILKSALVLLREDGLTISLGYLVQQLANFPSKETE